jgi:PAP_fibrillin
MIRSKRGSRPCWLLCLFGIRATLGSGGGGDALPLHRLAYAMLPAVTPKRHLERSNHRTATAIGRSTFPSFSPTTSAWSKWWTQLGSGDGKSASLSRQREQCKEDLLAECAVADKDGLEQRREAIDAAIAALAKVSPILDTASSLALQQTWQLVWTTEKEINLFLDKGWSTDISQSIRDDILTNCILFVQERGSFNVVGRLYRLDSDAPVRTRFEFQSATLSIKALSIPLPPVGKGWFDTVYLDDTFRVDVNSRNDILICRSIPS